MSAKLPDYVAFVPVGDARLVLSLGQAVEAYLRAQARMLSPETIKLYTHALDFLLAHFGDGMLLSEIDRAGLGDWRDSLYDVSRWSNHPTVPTQRDGLSVHTIRRIMGDVATFFNWLVSVGLLESSPMRGVKKPAAPNHKPKAISTEDFDKLLHEANIYRGNKWTLAKAYPARDTAILLFLASTGCRVGGLCSARISTLELVDNGGAVEVTEKGRGGGKSRMVYLSETAALATLEWLDHRPPTAHDYLFVSMEGAAAGKRMTTSAVRQMLIRLANHADVDGRFNPHSFRHACAREWLRNGADLKTVSQLLGHADIGITAKYYAVWSEDELQGRHDAVDWTTKRE